jgi:hypothetical protein
MAKMTAAKSLFRKNLQINPWRSGFYENDPRIKIAQLAKNLEFNEKLFLFFDPVIPARLAQRNRLTHNSPFVSC